MQIASGPPLPRLLCLTGPWLSAWRLLTAFAVLAVLYLAFAPAGEQLSSLAGFLHFMAFFVLSVLLHGSFPALGFGLQQILALTALGVIIEVVQLFIPYRHGELLDLATNEAGIFGWLLTAALWQHFFNR